MPETELRTFASLPLVGMLNLAARFAAILIPGDVVALRGDLGAGKTSFARAVIHALSKNVPEVTSPTFNVMQSYDIILANNLPLTLWHVDLYRLEKAAELESLGLEELWPQLTLIEWPEIAKTILPPERLDIAFGFGETPDTRRLVFSGNDAWRKRLETIT